MATTFNSSGQNYDRILEADDFTMSSPSRTSPSQGGGDGLGPVPDITAPQKMISAMSGSLFTSLLGKPLAMMPTCVD
jgi:solute carrier family 25 protein 39/40